MASIIVKIIGINAVTGNLIRDQTPIIRRAHQTMTSDLHQFIGQKMANRKLYKQE